MKNVVVNSILGAPIVVDNQPATIASLVKVIAGLTPLDKMTMKDCIHGCSVFSAADKAKETLELSESDVVWLKDVLEKYGPAAFGLNAARVREALMSE